MKKVLGTVNSLKIEKEALMDDSRVILLSVEGTESIVIHTEDVEQFEKDYPNTTNEMISLKIFVHEWVRRFCSTKAQEMKFSELLDDKEELSTSVCLEVELMRDKKISLCDQIEIQAKYMIIKSLSDHCDKLLGEINEYSTC